MTYKIQKNQLGGLFSAIAAKQKLYLPCTFSGKTDFALWGEDAAFDLDTLKTVKSAKEVFFPQCEDIVSFDTRGGNLTVTEAERETDDFVVFGVRGCDAAAFSILDSVFLSEPVDTFYKSRRDHGTVVTLCCSRPEETCFCSAFGIDAAAPSGDVTAMFSGDVLYLTPNTEKGLNLTKSVQNLLVPATQTDEKERAAEAENIRRITASLPLKNLDLSGWGKDELLEKFNSPLWKDLSLPCIGCGACTFSCPTCQCYDIRDFDKGNGVQRYRCWDSCMYSDFTMMAHGTPRPEKLQRFRQRFMHKLVYYPANNGGTFGCVGCGRCLERCPSGINIVKVIKAFGDNDR